MELFNEIRRLQEMHRKHHLQTLILGELLEAMCKHTLEPVLVVCDREIIDEARAWVETEFELKTEMHPSKDPSTFLILI